MSPKPLLLAVLMGILLPITSFCQQFSVNNVFRENDQQHFYKELLRVSPILQKITAATEMSNAISADEARAIVREQLNALKNPKLDKLYEEIDDAGTTQIGIALYIMMSGLSNVEDNAPVEPKAKFGGGFGVYVMWTLANFILMPELLYFNRGFKEEVAGNTTATRFAQLALALTALYVVHATTINFVFGISPILAYALSGKYVFEGGDKESIDFDDDGINRTTFQLGITAGILLKQAIMIRLIYGLGLSKVFDNSEAKLFMWALAINVPFSLFKAK